LGDEADALRKELQQVKEQVITAEKETAAAQTEKQQMQESLQKAASESSIAAQKREAELTSQLEAVTKVHTYIHITI